MPLQPDRLTLEQIIEKPEGSRPWVTIDSAQWDCQNIVFEYKGFGTVVSHTYATFTNTRQTIIGVATFPHKKTCEELLRTPPTGVISPVNAKMKESYQKKGLDFTKYANATSYLDLCTFCGRSSSLGLLICSLSYEEAETRSWH